MKKTRKGFTLIEMIVVIALISLLAVFVAPKVFTNLRQAREDIVGPRMALVASALEKFAINCGKYPDTLDDLIEAPAELEEKWRGKYISESKLLDPWGNRFLYNAESQNNAGSFDLFCAGPDGSPGTEDDAIYEGD